MDKITPPTLAELEKLAGGALESDPQRLYSHFKYLVHDDKGRAAWQALRAKDKNLDRDAVAVRVWSELETTHRSAIETQYHSLEYHRLWLFDWLLRRYDVRRARSVVGGGQWAQNSHVFLLLAVAAVYASRRVGLLGAYQTQWVLLLCAVAYAAVLMGLIRSFKEKLPDRREAFAVATHSLIPRLAGAAAVGLLFLVSSLELVPVILGTKPWWLLALLLAVYGYLLLEMSWRIHPLPRLGRLALHAFDISATALAHSLTLTLLAEGVLRKMLGAPKGSRPPFGWSESFSLVVFVFSIGLVVNLIWAEQPVTEPL